MPCAERVERFLSEHPSGKLTVIVGYASTWGIAWLARRTKDRTVTLFIGDLVEDHYEHATPKDRNTAQEFLKRHDVKIKTWRSDSEAPVHLKVWSVRTINGNDPVLSGSANLSKTGLTSLGETMGELADSDAQQLRQQIRSLSYKWWDAKSDLSQLIAPRNTPALSVRSDIGKAPSQPQQPSRGMPPPFSAHRTQEEPVHGATLKGRGSSPPPQTEPSNPGMRLGARAIDWLTLTVAGAMLLLFAGVNIVWNLQFYVVWIAYETITIAVFGETLGKRACNTRIVDARTGERLSLGWALLRTVLIGLTWPITAWSILWGRQFRGWHDMAAGSIAVRQPKRLDR